MKHIMVNPTLISSKIVREALKQTYPIGFQNSDVEVIVEEYPFGLVPMWERDGNLTLCRLFKDEDEVSWGWAKRNPSKDAESPTVGQQAAHNRALEKFVARNGFLETRVP